MSSDLNEINRISVILIYTNLGVGGISKSLITILNLLDYSRYDVTLYIRRDDVLDLLNEVPSQVNVITVNNEVKNRIFDDSFKDRIVKLLYIFLCHRHKHLAKKLLLYYKSPIQRKKEQKALEKDGKQWDVAVSYSTDNDDPIFVSECLNASKKYVFVHQSTELASKNVKALNCFNGVVSVNPDLESWLKKLVKPTTPVFSIENYVDFNLVRTLSKDIDLVSTHPFTIVTCGRLCLTKGYDYVIQTARILKQNSINFVWYWVGDGPSRKDMETYIQENDLQEQIIILGNQSNPYPYIKACKVYVQPSRAESYGLTIIEALILNRSVIMTKTKGAVWINNKYDAGILVDASASCIADILLDLYENPSKIRLEIEKTKLIQWENEKQRYLNQWNDLLMGD